MDALPQLMDPPPPLPEPVVSQAEITDTPVSTSSLAREERKKMLVQLEATLTLRELEVGELERFVEGLAGLKLDAGGGTQPDEQKVEEWLKVIERLFTWASHVAEERTKKLCEIRDWLDELHAGDETLAPVTGQILSRFSRLSERVQVLAAVDKEGLLGNLLHQIAKQRDLSKDEKQRLLQVIPDHRPIDNPVSTRRSDWYSDTDSTRRSDGYR